MRRACCECGRKRAPNQLVPWLTGAQSAWICRPCALEFAYPRYWFDPTIWRPFLYE